MQLRGARALVTGGSSGIGLATARLLAARAGAVTVIGSDPQRVRAAVAGPPPSGRGPQDAPSRVLGPSTEDRRRGGPDGPDTPDRPDMPDGPDVPGRLAGLVCDFADHAAVRALAATLSAAPAFDVLVHSAGIGLREPATETAEADVDRLFAVNVQAAITLTAALLPPMIARGRGRLVFVGSIAGAAGAAGEAVYAASKAALAAFGDSLRVELAGTGVGVTVVLPGVVDTAFFARRGVPYHRARPQPVPAQRVAAALVRAVARNRDVVVVPRWLRLPLAIKGVAPQRYSAMAARWGR